MYYAVVSNCSWDARRNVVSDALPSVIRESLRAIRAPKFFDSERAYQRALLTELQARLPDVKGLDDDAVVEQENQKRLAAHGLAI